MTVLRDYAATVSQPPLDDTVRPRRFDEMVGPDGSLRPAWKPLAELAVGLTAHDLYRVDGDIVRMLADEGVTYGRPGERPGPWRLDPVPLLVDAPTWAPLEVGLAQRTELLNALLVDLYGEQRVLRERVVPAPVVLGHPGFVRAMAGARMADSHPLIFSATDVGRDGEGGWRAVADRTQAPSGIGYAMENRRVLSRVLPELYRESGLHRMEPYFWALRSALMQAAPTDTADPRVVVLTPGTHSETAYDQAFVASTLGFPLVEGSDLVVRDGWVYLRQARGRLERVDVILRRVDAAWSDPLELRGESQLGVVGLTEAARRGRVRVVNPIGAGVLENPALMPYLPAACELLLGEPLLLDSAETWWCGEAAGLEAVLDAFASDPELRLTGIDGEDAGLAGLPRSEVVQRLLATPHRYVGQRTPVLSQVPTWRAGSARPRPVTLRTFTVRYGSAYRPLVGGMANVLDELTGRSSASKDVWVLKADPADIDQGLSGVLAATPGRAAPVAAPRVLEDLFWTGRYAERAEDLLRVLLVTHAVAEDYRTRPRTAGGTSLEVLLASQARLAGRVHADLDEEFRSVLLDADRVGGVGHSIASLRDALAGVRDQLSTDTWRAFGVIDRAVELLEGTRYSHQIAESAGRHLTGLLSLQGSTANMMQDEGWRLLSAGRLLERALQLCHLLVGTTTERRGLDVDRAVLGAVLEAAESGVTHRRRFRGYVRPAGVLDLLLLDPDNPRSLLHCLVQLRGHLAHLPGSTGSTRPERLLENLLSEVEAQEVSSLVAIGGADRPLLTEFLETMLDRLTTLADAIADHYLAVGPPPRPLNSLAVLESLPLEPVTGTIPIITDDMERPPGIPPRTPRGGSRPGGGERP
ncbi:circularly permuted type 2 ATP-grasp protein [Nocardioides sp. GY 10127]|uniref:circularly permuted type 2 ATP-grasp protein n=1 Tax=Nocardioides sp. GY 10127 TaxID=2569762 RepID=UPI0010A76741|nr:circularly permuted type 2 ATP-grasp protein [Nocardioides sp. GY 10127]TIC82898.1 hypothetical protein E8D37_09600 [Nocardioides sp. GY 10127]